MNAAPVRVRVNGLDTDTVSVFDRGLAYGDGLFETLPVRQARPIDLASHLMRLTGACAALGMPMPDLAVLEAEANDLCAGHERAVLKIIITRGIGGRGYRPGGNQALTRILSVHAWPDYPDCFADTGIILRLCRTRLAIQPQLAGLKHLNRLEQVLARSEWDEAGIPEGLMCDTEGRVIEGTQSNVFLIKDGGLITPIISRCGVQGIARERILHLAPNLDIACEQRDVSLDELLDADELFVCNSLIGIWPVQAFVAASKPEPRRYTPGSVTRQLQQAYRNIA